MNSFTTTWVIDLCR